MFPHKCKTQQPFHGLTAHKENLRNMLQRHYYLYKPEKRQICRYHR